MHYALPCELAAAAFVAARPSRASPGIVFAPRSSRPDLRGRIFALRSSPADLHPKHMSKLVTPMDTRARWERVYATKASHEVSWFSPHLATSISLIERSGEERSAAILDVGGGESTLVDDLIARGYRNVTVLDIAQNAIEHSKARLGAAADSIRWLVADIAQAELTAHSYDVWHDRAVFHFLTRPLERRAYIRQIAAAVKPGGHVILGTFGPEGPEKCSGFDVMRYDAESLHQELGLGFRLVESLRELHHTPAGDIQQFLYCHCVLG
jgi:SAM-dependent methyltransferase